jgi:long-subunit acyl-CoA synthetase (AMP-forming)
MIKTNNELIEKIFLSLDNWGAHPVFIEVPTNTDKKASYTTAPEIKQKILDMADFLKSAGIGKNFFGIMFLENSVDFVTVFLGLMHIGAKPIPSKLEYRAIELNEVFANSDPQVIIAEEYHLPRILPYIKNRIVITRNDGKFKLYQIPKKQREPKDDVPDDIASINYTYRGYGYPLGAMVPYRQYLYGAKVLQDGVQLKEKENLLIILPMSHIFTIIGCLILPMLYHITSIIINTVHPRKIFEYVNKYKINNILAVPEIYRLLLKFIDISPNNAFLKELLSGGSVLLKEDYVALKNAFQTEVIHGYGLTEFTPVSRHVRGATIPGTIGPISDGIKYQILADKNGDGELLIQTSNMTKAYYKRQTETRDAFDGMWFKTGDICRQENNHIVFIKEKKETRKLNGNMIDLEEVKKTLLMHPKIKEAFVECNNNVLSARIKVNAVNDIKAEILQIKDYLENNISSYKIPKTLMPV